MPKSTFERAVEPRSDEPEAYTPGPFIRHGVMVRDTTETTGGMFCIRRAGEAVTIGGRPFRKPEEVLAYAYSRADADLLAAAPLMLDALRWAIGMAEEAITAREQGDDPEDTPEIIAMHREALQAAQYAIFSAEGRR